MGVSWRKLFTSAMPLVEFLVRGALISLALFLLLRVVLMADTLRGTYSSIPNGVLLVVFEWVPERIGVRHPTCKMLVNPPCCSAGSGWLLLGNLRRDSIRRSELVCPLWEQG